MTKEAVIKATILFSFLLGLLSSLVALLTGGDLFSVIVERFIVVFIVSAVLTWIAITIVNSIVISEARRSVDELRESLKEEQAQQGDASALEDLLEGLTKGQNLDITSEPSDEVGADTLNLEDVLGKPELKEFEPFKPRRIEADKEESGN